MARSGQVLMVFVLAGAIVPGWLTGCEREGVRAYSVPKEAPRRDGGAPDGSPALGAGNAGDMSGTLPKSTVPPAAASAVGARIGAFEPPKNWTAEAEGSGILAAAYTAENADGEARITLTSLFNDGGGLLLNINRWRGQLELAPVGSLEEQPKTDLGGGAVLVDLRDAKQTRRMVMAVVPDGQATGGGQTWFFKLTGSVKGAEAERAAFERFVRAVGLGEP